MLGGDFMDYGYAPTQTGNDSTPDNYPAITKLGLPGFLTTGYSTGNGTLSPATYLIGLIGLLILLKIVGDDKRTGIQPAHFYISGYNVATVTTVAIVGIVSLKIIFNKIQIPGLTDLINAA